MAPKCQNQKKFSLLSAGTIYRKQLKNMNGSSIFCWDMKTRSIKCYLGRSCDGVDRASINLATIERIFGSSLSKC
uniref:Uncharacterized protein n=1 Tax=Romanomermis culicivorax TaxID=13658 RepID=A0A915IIR7_ROMCU